MASQPCGGTILNSVNTQQANNSQLENHRRLKKYKFTVG